MQEEEAEDVEEAAEMDVVEDMVVEAQVSSSNRGKGD